MDDLRYLLDTNVLSEPLLPSPNQRLLERMKDHRDDISTASVVWHELLFGGYSLPPSARREAILRYLNEVVVPTIQILPYDTRAARWHAEERARLAGIGRTPPFADGQIAAVARTNDLALVTANLSDYEDFRDLRVVDWRV